MTIRSEAKKRLGALKSGYPKRPDVPQGKRPVGSSDAAALRVRKQAEAMDEGNIRRGGK